MTFKAIILAIILLLVPYSILNAAECTRYETLHPLYPLTGAHLSTGKCTSCGLCHIPAGNAVWNGTPRTCIACHNGDPHRNTVGRSAKHLPTLLEDCAGCHNTTLFNSFTGITQLMIHNTAISLRCGACHNGAYTAYNAQGKSNDHPKTVKINGVTVTVANVDCNYSGCHSSSSRSFSD